jgi:hypothetical protein
MTDPGLARLHCRLCGKSPIFRAQSDDGFLSAPLTKVAPPFRAAHAELKKTQKNAQPQITTPSLGAPPLLNHLIFTHIFGWTRGVHAFSPNGAR